MVKRAYLIVLVVLVIVSAYSLNFQKSFVIMYIHSPITTNLAAGTTEEATCSGIVAMKYRSHKIKITDFGGVGDGKTVNTKAFEAAVFRIRHLNRPGGIVLYVPPGVFVTGSFNLTSHMTLYLARGAVLRAIQDTERWPLIAPLPSYGRGRERPGGRYISLLHGNGIQDVVITGDNGTIDGQGDVWWKMFKQRTLRYTRPGLVEFMNSENIIISNVVLRDSPFWNIHPVYCNNFVVRYVTVLAPRNSPNTDGVDPDSSSNVCIEDSYMNTGDDLVAVKSGWDQYGIAYGRRSTGITVRRLTGSSPFAGIAIGSEVSGGVSNIVAENINLFDMGMAIHIKSNTGRGGFIRNVTLSNFYIENARRGIKITNNAGNHPDNKYDRNALTIIEGIILKGIRGVGVRQAGVIHGLKDAPLTGICLYNVNFKGNSSYRNSTWRCSNMVGDSVRVSPRPCSQFSLTSETGSCSNYFQRR